MSKKFAVFALAFIAGLMVWLFATQAILTNKAQSDNGQSTQNSIWSGLWAGANFNFDYLKTNSTAQSVNTQFRSGTSEQNSDVVMPRSSSGVYVALGDSVAAGLGLGSGDECGRSNQAYPALVARERGLELKHIACSGATAGDLVTQQRVDGPNPPAQLSRAFSNGQPELITITAGANDVHWVDFLRACYAYDCSSSVSTASVDTYRAILATKLYYVFSDIEARSNGQPPKVMITGYYRPLSSKCSSQSSAIASKEIAWLNSQVSKLNNTIKNAARNFDFVQYVPISFSGHELCTSSPWIQSLEDPAPIHPNAAGQRAIAQSILSLL